MNVEIRQYRNSDYDAVWDLHKAALAPEGAFLESGPWDDDLKDIDGHYLQQHGEFLVATIENTLVGMGALRKVNRLTSEIKRMRVHPEHQRSGIGQKLLDELEKKARILGYKNLMLDTTDKQKAAQNFYRKNGYHEIRREKRPQFTLIFFVKSLE